MTVDCVAAYRTRTSESVCELSDWNCVATSPQRGAMRRRRPFACELDAWSKVPPNTDAAKPPHQRSEYSGPLHVGEDQSLRSRRAAAMR
jgi:hypothetical protein